MTEFLIPYRLGIQQRILPFYRAAFFDQLASVTQGGLSVFAGSAQAHETVEPAKALQQAQWQHARNIHLFRDELYLCWQQNLMRWLSAWDPDVLIMEANPRYLHSGAAIRWMKKQGRSVIGWGLGSGGIHGGDGWRGLVWQRFIQQFDAIIAYSHAGADEYQALGMHRDKIFIAANATIAPKSSLTHWVTREPKKSPALLFVGRLQERKKIDLLIKACATVVKQIPIELWIVGDGPERESLQEFAAEVFPSTQFFGAKYGDDAAVIFQQADLFVLPGTGGLAVQEAMSFGLPVIVGEADGTQSNLVTERNGWILEDVNADAIASAIFEALSDSDRLRVMGQESLRIVQQTVNLDQMVKSFAEAIRSLKERN